MAERYKIYQKRSERKPNVEFDLSCFQRRPLSCELGRYIDRIQPGIFIVGGTARYVALNTICDIPEQELPKPLDIDLLTLARPRVYCEGSPDPFPERRIVTAGPNLDHNLQKYLSRQDFTLNQVLVGRTTKHEQPTLFLTDQALEDYHNKIFRFSDQFGGVERDSNGKITMIENACMTLRVILYSLVLSPFDFTDETPNDVIIMSLRRNWKTIINDGYLKEYVERSRCFSLQDQFIANLRSCGFTVPERLIS